MKEDKEIDSKTFGTVCVRTHENYKKHKYSKKYLRRIKKRILGCTFSIAMSLMLIAGGRLADISMPLNKAKLKNLSTSMETESNETVLTNRENSQNSTDTGERLENTDTITYIYDANDLANFRDSVNSGNDYSGKTVYVMADIDMSSVCSEELGVSWTPIGETGAIFSGILDGNYYKISKLYYNSNSYNTVGLFTNNNGTIQNLILEDVNIYAYKGENVGINVGGIVGINTGTIQNCGVNSGNITGYNVTPITSGYRGINIRRNCRIK